MRLSGASFPYASNLTSFCVLTCLKRSGDPHATGNDPWHVTVIVGRKNIKGKDRLTSAHVYPDGTVRFSDKQFGEVKVSAREAATGEQGSAGPAESAEPAGPKWIWDEAENRYRYWNGAEWIWQ